MGVGVCKGSDVDTSRVGQTLSSSVWLEYDITVGKSDQKIGQRRTDQIPGGLEFQ